MSLNQITSSNLKLIYIISLLVFGQFFCLYIMLIQYSPHSLVEYSSTLLLNQLGSSSAQMLLLQIKHCIDTFNFEFLTKPVTSKEG